MDSTWTASPTNMKVWVDVAQGINIRKSKHFIIPNFTKRMAHIMMQCDKSFTFEDAVRWAQVKALGGDKRIFDALRETSLRGREFFGSHREEYNLKFIQWLVNNPMLDTVHVGPIYDYIAHKYAQGRVYNIIGRTPQALLRDIDQWHIEVNQQEKIRRIRKKSWDHHPDIKDNKYTYKEQSWQFIQLLSVSQLRDEGRRMHNCVGSYAMSCANGDSFIFSLRSNGASYVTIEVVTRNERLMIIQARTHCNRRPSRQEWKLVEKWAKDNKLQISSWLV